MADETLKARQRSERLAEFLALRGEGLSVADISEQTGWSRTTVWRDLTGENSAPAEDDDGAAESALATAVTTTPARPPVPLERLQSGSRPPAVDDEVDHGKLADRILNPSWRIR